MVKSAIGETVTAEDLGGAYVHTQHSGGRQTQEEGIRKLRDIMEFEPSQPLCCEKGMPAARFDYPGHDAFEPR